ncbi:7-cyano-7-deazaguanine synthase [Streptomyces sp. NPDC007070]|uniref:7-cyano-7-deazaguanine synthase n=1 Tax=Streptomyces sp. NPDC007070 TaxID=3154312 RepID=UPI003404300F
METATETPEQIRLLERQIEAALLEDDRIADCAVVFQGASAMEVPAERCTRCGMDAAYPGTVLDGDGVCDLCLMYERHGKEILAYFGDVDAFVRQVRERAEATGSAYDCLLLFSGGKDSTYVLHQLVRRGLRVMTFTFDNGFISRTALENVETITRALGVEHVTMDRAGQNRIFVQSLQQHKSVCNGCFRSLLDLSHRFAHERGIPSIVTGLSRGQIIDERLLWFYRNGEFDPERIECQLEVGRKVYHQVGSELADGVLDQVEVIDYYRYSDVTKDDIRAFLQREDTFWSAPKDTGFCSSNCMINDVGVYVHKLERGFHNYESPTRWEVRLGHLAREEADQELRTPVNLPRVRSMLAKIGYTDPGDRSRLGRRMAAYYVPRSAVDEAAARAAVAERLPELLLPEYWIEVPQIPRAAGAVDRRALPDPTPDAGKRLVGHEAAAADWPAGPPPTTVPFSPVQSFLAQQGGAGELGRARAILLELPEGVSTEEVRRAVLELLLRHPELRSPLRHENGRWSRGPAEPAAQVPLAQVDLSRQASARQPILLRVAAERLGTQVASGTAPLLRAALVTRSEGPRLLLLVAHEVAVDVPGWQRLLTTLTATLAPGADARHTPASAPSARPQAVGLLEDSAERNGDDVCVLPEAALGDGTHVWRTVLDAADTAALLASGVPVPDLLAATVAQALTGWLGAPAAVLGIADHTGGTDARSGWFRVTPDRSDADERSFAAAVASVGRPEQHSAVRLSHLGDLDTLCPPDGPLKPVTGAGVGLATVLGARSHPLEITSHLSGGQLHLDWAGAAGLFDKPAQDAADTLRALARQVRKAPA